MRLFQAVKVRGGAKNPKILLSAYNTVTRQFLYVILLKNAEVLVRHSRKQ